CAWHQATAAVSLRSRQSAIFSANRQALSIQVIEGQLQLAGPNVANLNSNSPTAFVCYTVTLTGDPVGQQTVLLDGLPPEETKLTTNSSGSATHCLGLNVGTFTVQASLGTLKSNPIVLEVFDPNCEGTSCFCAAAIAQALSGLDAPRLARTAGEI